MADSTNKMNRYCIICGNILETKFSDDFCSVECGQIFQYFKQTRTLKSVSGFCNICGKTHLLEKNKGMVLHRHPNCYLHNIPLKANSIAPLKKKKINCRIINQKQSKEEKRNSLIERSSFSLSQNKLYDEDTHLLICPTCTTYSVSYSNECDSWECSVCDKSIKSIKIKNSINFYNLSFTDQDKYKLYKFYGIEAIMNLTTESRQEVQDFVSSYFKRCCTEKGKDCLYISHIEEVASTSNKINHIKSIFSEAKNEYKLFKKEIINYHLKTTEDYFLTVMEQKLFDNEILVLKETVKTMIEELDEYLIPYADSELRRGQKVYLEINDEKLIAHPEKIGETEAFCWTDANKGELVGVCAFSPDSLSEVKLMLYELENKYDAESSLAKFFKKLEKLELSKLELDVLDILTENGSYFQNQLWRKVGIDSRKCSRVVKSLVDKGLVTREAATDNGARTYILYINV